MNSTSLAHLITDYRGKIITVYLLRYGVYRYLTVQKTGEVEAKDVFEATEKVKAILDAE